MHLKLSTEAADFSIGLLTVGQNLSKKGERKSMFLLLVKTKKK